VESKRTSGVSVPSMEQTRAPGAAYWRCTCYAAKSAVAMMALVAPL
jgi:hypothetical protein